ncbi:MAG: hypothetical protein ACPGYV_07530 [Phycisphaeraceae bacterium]
MASPSPKQRVAELAQQLPDDATYDEIQHHFHAAEVIRQRIDKSDDPATPFSQTKKRSGGLVDALPSNLNYRGS